jgi:hypothetical protein
MKMNFLMKKKQHLFEINRSDNYSNDKQIRYDEIKEDEPYEN